MIFSRYTLGVCAGVALLGGCGSNSGIPSANATAPSAMRDQVDIEKIGGRAQQSGLCYVSRGYGIVTVSGKGHAMGPYPGTFTGSATFYADCAQGGPTQITGEFIILSGANTIIGSFSGRGTQGCDRRTNQKCGASSDDLAYTATLRRGGKVRKYFTGYGPGHFGCTPVRDKMAETLGGM